MAPKVECKMLIDIIIFLRKDIIINLIDYSFDYSLVGDALRFVRQVVKFSFHFW